jgi:hypothetical protein
VPKSTERERERERASMDRVEKDARLSAVTKIGGKRDSASMESVEVAEDLSLPTMFEALTDFLSKELRDNVCICASTRGDKYVGLESPQLPWEQSRHRKASYYLSNGQYVQLEEAYNACGARKGAMCYYPAQITLYDDADRENCMKYVESITVLGQIPLFLHHYCFACVLDEWTPSKQHKEHVKKHIRKEVHDEVSKLVDRLVSECASAKKQPELTYPERVEAVFESMRTALSLAEAKMSSS